MNKKLVAAVGVAAIGAGVAFMNVTGNDAKPVKIECTRVKGGKFKCGDKKYKPKDFDILVGTVKGRKKITCTKYGNKMNCRGYIERLDRHGK